jgi:hypothetical protein
MTVSKVASAHIFPKCTLAWIVQFLIKIWAEELLPSPLLTVGASILKAKQSWLFCFSLGYFFLFFLPPLGAVSL